MGTKGQVHSILASRLQVPHIDNCGVQDSFCCLTNTSNCLLLLTASLHGNSAFHLRSIIVMVLSSTTSLVISAECTLMDTRYRLWGTRVMILSRALSFSILLENSTSRVSIFLHSTLYPSKSESGGVQEHAMAVEVWGRQWRLCILSGSRGMLRSWSSVGKGTGIIQSLFPLWPLDSASTILSGLEAGSQNSPLSHQSALTDY